jgi:hypothetical protein
MVERETSDPAFVIAYMLREIIFTIVVFWEIAKINELSIELTEAIGQNCNLDDFDVEKQTRLFLNTFSKLILFPLAGMTLTRKDIIFRLILWVTSVLIGVVQQNM